jgi:catechol 2,3-dioxygenase-like lactoylglutathione lyase family enzyme
MFTCNHISQGCSDLEQSFDFYVNKLGLTLLQRWPKMFAVRAGEVRISVFQTNEVSTSGNVEIILRTDNIEAAKDSIRNNNIPLIQDIVEAPGFMRFFSLKDPDGNVLHIGEYLRDPLEIGG